jgi:hypothetical protein
MALTGRFTFRRSLGGRIILQVEEEVRTLWPFSRRTPFKKRWRDATLMDLAAPELRALIDLRYKPQFMAQYDYLASEPSRQSAASEADAEGASPAFGDGQRAAGASPGGTPPVAVEVERLDDFVRRNRQGGAA